MRGELDDALARMARREALQRQRAAEAAGRAASPADEVTEAVQRVVGQHPSVAVTMWVADGSSLTALHIGWSDGVVTVRPAAEPALPTAGEPPHSWPLAVRTAPNWTDHREREAGGPAARLADLIRRNPSLLHDAEEDR